MNTATEEIRAMTAVDEVNKAIARANRHNRELWVKRAASFAAGDWWLEQLRDRHPGMVAAFEDVHAVAEAEVERSYKDGLAPLDALHARLSELSGPEFVSLGGDEE